MVDKRILLIFCLIGFFCFFGHEADVQAQTPSVTDCIEGNADCAETEGTQENQAEEGDGTQENNSQIENNTENNNGTGSLVMNIIRMFFALGIVLALIYLLVKLLSKRNKLFNHVNALENLGGLSVGSNKSIQIIRIGDHFYLIGVGENVELLQEITDEAVLKEWKENKQAKENTASSFARSLAGKQKQSGQKQTGVDFRQQFSDELKKLKQNRQRLKEKQKQKEEKNE